MFPKETEGAEGPSLPPHHATFFISQKEGFNYARQKHFSREEMYLERSPKKQDEAAS